MPGLRRNARRQDAKGSTTSKSSSVKSLMFRVASAASAKDISAEYLDDAHRRRFGDSVIARRVFSAP